MNLKSYNEEVKKRMELVKKAFDGSYRAPESFVRLDKEYKVRNLLDYLEGLTYFVEEEKKNLYCGKCGNPLHARGDERKCLECKWYNKTPSMIFEYKNIVHYWSRELLL